MSLRIGTLRWVALASATGMLLMGCAERPPSSRPSGSVDTQTTPEADRELQVHFIDAGQGDATLMLAPGVTVLIDTGRHTATDVVDYLDRQGVERIDVLAITHPHADHIGQFDRVLQRFAVTEVWWSPTAHTTQTFDRALTALEDSDAAYEEPPAGYRTDVGPLRFEIVNPPTGSSGGLHDTVLAFRVTYRSVAFLFTGDAEQATEERMLAEHAETLGAQVYQVGHHGSATSTSPVFLAAVAPRVAVYSAGLDNQFGHPHREVVERLVGSDVALYGTDVHGTVVVTTDGVDLWVDTTTGAPTITHPRSSQ